MMQAKLATVGLLKTKVFRSTCYGVIISVYNVTNKILSHDSNYIVYVAMWPKFRNSSISLREVITLILQGFNQKNQIFWGVSLVQVQQFGTGTRYDFKILHQIGKNG